MPNKTCLKCQHENLSFNEDQNAECPKCGAIYSKVEAHHKLQEDNRLKQEFKGEEDRRLAEQRDAQRKAYAAQGESAIQERIKAKQFICMKCNSCREPKTKTVGNIFIEILIWLIGLALTVTFIYFIFGIIILLSGMAFSIYRMTSKIKVCAVCNSPDIIPANSPRGKALLGNI